MLSRLSHRTVVWEVPHILTCLSEILRTTLGQIFAINQHHVTMNSKVEILKIEWQDL